MQEPQKVRINKLLSQAGVASRREAEKLIHAGSVILNGKTVTEPGQTMLPGTDHLTVEGRKIRFHQAPKTKVYALYKPRNCITSLNDPEGRRTVKDFFPRDAGRLFPVGRLDYDAEGLLLLTNDGMLAHRLMHPNHKVWKSYFVKVKGMVSEQVLRNLRKGPKISGSSSSRSWRGRSRTRRSARPRGGGARRAASSRATTTTRTSRRRTTPRHAVRCPRRRRRGRGPPMRRRR